MMRAGAIALLLLLFGCASHGSTPPEPPEEELPAGVFAPIPGADIWNASVAAEGDTLWWATMRRTEDSEEFLFREAISLSATSVSGESRVQPTEVAPNSGSIFDPDVLVTPSAIVAKLGGVQTLLRRYDRNGSPLGSAYPIAIAADFINVNEMELIATAGGGAQLVAALQSDSAEIAIVELDADGVVGATRTAGTPDTADGGTTAGTIGAAARPDGSTLVAWDRGYNGCISTRPSSTLTTSIDAASVGSIQTVRDLPDSEAHPAIATSGAAAYITWLSYSAEGSRVALARYPDVATVIAEVGDPNQFNRQLMLALAAADRGAIAWQSNDSAIQVVRFEDRAGTVQLGPSRSVSLVDAGAGMAMVGLVHVGDDRYVVAWIESEFDGLENPHRLYATLLDLGTGALRPAVVGEPTTTVRPRRPRCP